MMGKSKQKKLKAQVKSANNSQPAAVQKPQRKKVVLNVLDSPFHIQWPEIGAENEKVALECLERSLVPFRKPSVSVTSRELRNIPKDKRREWRAAKQAESENLDTVKSRENQNKSLIVGLNKVTQALETGGPVLVVAERQCDPPLLTRFLIPLCGVKAVPLLAIRQVSSLFTTKLQLPRCLCIAFKSEVKNEGNVLNGAYNRLLDVYTKCKVNQLPSTGNGPSVEVSEPVSRKGGESMEVDNTPNFHLRKLPNGKPAFVPGQLNPLSGEAADSVKLGSDFVSFQTDDADIDKSPAAAKPVKSKLFRDMRVKRLQSNPNKLKKK